MELRTTCVGCPCLESKQGRDFCYWYQGWVDRTKPCGNVFKTRPEHTQEELEEIVFGSGEEQND